MLSLYLNFFACLRFAKAYGPTITKFLEDNYCPEIDSPDCAHDVNTHYPQILVNYVLYIIIGLQLYEASILNDFYKLIFTHIKCDFYGFWVFFKMLVEQNVCLKIWVFYSPKMI